MPIKFNVVPKGNPSKPIDPKKFYASAISQGETTIEGFTKKIEKISTVSGADIRAVLYALVDVMVDEVAEGNIARLGDLGSFRVNISSEGKEKESEVNATTITGGKIIFTPSNKLRDMLKTLKYEKA